MYEMFHSKSRREVIVLIREKRTVQEKGKNRKLG